ncbi:MAG: hypothetical protein N3G20_08410, partial [Verrucomicrobiae bacterium]|nr:hypothetical protein [Verrucomicrobiae bacterium]
MLQPEDEREILLGRAVAGAGIRLTSNLGVGETRPANNRQQNEPDMLGFCKFGSQCRQPIPGKGS